MTDPIAFLIRKWNTTALFRKSSSRTFGIVTASLGIIADIGTPVGSFLGILFYAALLLSVLSVLGFAAFRNSAITVSPGIHAGDAAGWLAVRSSIAVLILAPLLLLNSYVGGDRGVLVQSVEQVLRYLKLGEEHDSYATARDVMDRLLASRDGANQGQREAMPVLLRHAFDFAGGDYSGISFNSVKLEGADFSKAKLHFADFRGASARKASFRDAGLRLMVADENSHFDEADLSGVYAPLIKANDASFRGASLANGDFYGADLRGADLSGADLMNAKFVNADLRNANLSGAKLDGAHFIGALLQGAKLDGARFRGTDMLGAALDPSLLDPAQRAHTCRTQISGSYSRVAMTERWESSKFRSGHDYREINEFDNWVPTGPVDDLSLRVCPSEANSSRTYKTAFPFQVRFTLDRDYLKSAGRRALAVERFKDMRSRLEQGRRDAVFFTGDGAYMAGWVQAMRKSAADVEAVGPPFVDTDFMLVFLLHHGLLSAEAVNWQQAMNTRLKFERTIQAKFNGNFPRVTHWGPFFPKDVSIGDMPKEGTELFRKWTIARADSLGDEIVTRPATMALDQEGPGMTLTFKTGALRITPEGLTPEISSLGLSEEVAKLAVSKENLASAPVRLYGMKRIMFAYPVKIDRYRARLPERPNNLRKFVPDLELKARVTRTKKLDAGRSQKVVIVFIEPESATLCRDMPPSPCRGVQVALEVE